MVGDFRFIQFFNKRELKVRWYVQNLNIKMQKWQAFRAAGSNSDVETRRARERNIDENNIQMRFEAHPFRTGFYHAFREAHHLAFASLNDDRSASHSDTHTHSEFQTRITWPNPAADGRHIAKCKSSGGYIVWMAHSMGCLKPFKKGRIHHFVTCTRRCLVSCLVRVNCFRLSLNCI